MSAKPRSRANWTQPVKSSPCGRELALANLHGRYHAIFDGAILCTSKTPFLAAARVLKELAHDADALLQAQHEGASIIAMWAKIGAAAGLTVEERDNGKGPPRFVAYTTFQDAQEHAGASPQTAVPAPEAA